ncbi:MAG: hypothetical protein PHF63_00350 [Herbinix sp.]|nr:hypothetical protein [Herbinix sp.]
MEKDKRVINIGDELFEVKGAFNPNVKLKKNIGYIVDDHVYIYKGKKTSGDNDPGIYRNENEYEVIPYTKPKDIERFSITKIVELGPESIKSMIDSNKDRFITSENLEFVKNNDDIFTVTINEDDDFLKMLIKTAINEKKIDLKMYKDKFSDSYVLNNMKSSLMKETKMSVPIFNQWCEILGLKWTIMVEDNGEDYLSPLCSTITLSNENPANKA